MQARKSSIFFLVGILGALLFSCSTPTQNKVLKQDAIIGLASPVKLNPEENKIRLEDYFLNPDTIDSIQISIDISFNLPDNMRFVEFVAPANIPAYSTMTCFVGEEAYTIMLEKSRKQKHKLVFDPAGKKYEKVQVKGSMNDWNPSLGDMKLVDGKWEIEGILNPGKYHYLFMVDGVETIDPNNPEKEDNNIGGFNSVLHVGNNEGSNRPFIQSQSFTDNQIKIKSQNTDKIYALWENHLLKSESISEADGVFDLKIPSEASTKKRSWIRVFSYNESGKGNNLLIPLEYGKVVNSVAQLDRSDKETSVLYFMMVDRFNNGNPQNDKQVNDPEVHPKANYHGGDIAGIIQKLEEGYFEELGINTIWLSPIVQNTWGAFTEYPAPHRKFTGYHGYWPTSLVNIDKRFGTDEDLQKLIDLAHKKDINVLLDFISNHLHQNSSLFTNNPDWVTQLDLPDGSQNIRKWDEQRLTTWFDTFLPSLDHDQLQVRELVSDSAIYWVEKFGIDGFRHDATKHIPMSFWYTFTKKMKQLSAKHNKRLYQVGETFGGRELIGSYVGSGKLDAQFDFNMYWDIRSVFALDNESFVKLDKSVHETFDYYGCNHLMGNVSGNHDIPRFISFASGALAFDEDSQEAGWSRDIKVEDPVGYKKLQSLVAYSMTIPGVPVIYYGDEIGMPGAGDPDNRRPMRFENLTPDEAGTKQMVSKLVKLRKNSMALQFGDYQSLHVDQTSYAYCRNYFDETVIVVFNKSRESQNIEFELPFTVNKDKLKKFLNNPISVDGNKMNVELGANSFEIISYKSDIMVL